MRKYKIIYQNGNNKEEVIVETKNLSNEKLPQNIIDICELKENFRIDFKRKKRINDKKINLLFYELNLMLQANINISDALDILIKNKKDANIIEFLQIIKYCLSNGKPVTENLKRFHINYIIISFLEISQDNGSLALNIKALSQLLIENQKIKKSFLKSISYPIILLFSFFISLISIFTFVIPKFKIIFLQSQGELPLATKILLQTEYFFANYIIYLFLSIASGIFFVTYLYKQNKNFNYFLHKIVVENLYLIKDIYLYMQFYRFFLLLDIMLKSNYEFHKALISSKILLKNKYLLDKISIIDSSLQNGEGINASFFKTQIFDDIVLNLINTGEISNSLCITIDEIKKIYKNRFYEKINLLTSLIQPIFLVIIMGLILWIVLAIFMPIWNMGNMINP